MLNITYSNSQHNLGPRELAITRHSKIDATKARRWLTSFAAVLEYAAESTDSRELIAALDCVRRAPAMLSGLEAQ